MSSVDQRRGAMPTDDDELKASEIRFRRFNDAVPAIAWASGPNGSPEFWNKRWHEYTGLSVEASSGSGWQTAVHPDDLDELARRWRSDVASGQAGEIDVRLRRFDGVYRWFFLRYEPSRNGSGNVSNWYGTGLDIEERKRADETLRRNEEQFRTITDLIPQYIVVLAPNGNVQYVNQVALERTGIQMEDVQKEDSFWLPFHPDDVARVRAERRDGLSRKIPFELEVRVRLTNGQYRWHLVQYNPQKDDVGQVLRWYATGTDIDARKKAEEMLRNENVALREEIDRSSMFDDIVGSSKPMRQVLQQVMKVAPSDSTVLILGETGTGKEMIARALHRRSNRSARVFIRVNCAAIPEALIASELFGHEKGAFTGALQKRVGRFEAAHGGTLFLDEVGDLPMETQIALLRVLQEREFERVGSNHPISVNVRLIAATNRDLRAAIAAGTFREDLFYRLNVFPISIPPLRERKEDIPALVEYFVERYAQKAAKTIRRIASPTLAQMKAYPWPGNIRELQNVVERAVILTDTDTFTIDESWLKCEPARSGRREGSSAVEAREIEMIENALAESHGRISGAAGAAAKLGIPRQTLESKIRRLGINRYGGKG
jgi:formate hydrogenlyase transcriptional activator